MKVYQYILKNIKKILFEFCYLVDLKYEIYDIFKYASN